MKTNHLCLQADHDHLYSFASCHLFLTSAFPYIPQNSMMLQITVYLSEILFDTTIYPCTLFLSFLFSYFTPLSL